MNEDRSGGEILEARLRAENRPFTIVYDAETGQKTAIIERVEPPLSPEFLEQLARMAGHGHPW